MQPIVAVIGAGKCSLEIRDLAYHVGYGLAQHQITLVCGGLQGVMAAACEGAKAAGGITIGILPGTDPTQANPWVDVAIATGLGEARNMVLVHTAQVLVAIAGEYGTLSEIAFALKLGKPIIGLRTWQPMLPGQQQPTLAPTLAQVETPEAAVAWVVQQLTG